jgi:hypothetical protein
MCALMPGTARTSVDSVRTGFAVPGCCSGRWAEWLRVGVDWFEREFEDERDGEDERHLLKLVLALDFTVLSGSKSSLGVVSRPGWRPLRHVRGWPSEGARAVVVAESAE